MTDSLDRLKAAFADRYAIERELGAGGMATVYLAQDLKLERRVALKVLRPELAEAIGAERFLRETKITARLTHPHILPLLDSGVAEEQPTALPPYRRTAVPPSHLPPYRPTAFLYYTMPYVAGESLRDRLNREKQLPVEEALRLTAEVADALGSAHRHDFVHRDIKPENILLEEGHAVVADFGVARAIPETEETRLTETGIAVGTPAYLSPEQASGERDIDGRSDIYALGCVLFEMLAGRAPFVGPTVESVVQQHIAAKPPPVNELRPTVPEAVVGTVSKALAKAPADRWQSAEELLRDLTKERVEISSPDLRTRRAKPLGSRVTAVVVLVVLVLVILSRLIPWPGSGSDPGPPVLAVLPVLNLGSAADETLAEGLALETSSMLSGLSGLRVIAYSSTQEYKDTDKSDGQIGSELGAHYLLRMTVQWQRA